MVELQCISLRSKEGSIVSANIPQLNQSVIEVADGLVKCKAKHLPASTHNEEYKGIQADKSGDQRLISRSVSRPQKIYLDESTFKLNTTKKKEDVITPYADNITPNHNVGILEKRLKDSASVGELHKQYKTTIMLQRTSVGLKDSAKAHAKKPAKSRKIEIPRMSYKNSQKSYGQLPNYMPQYRVYSGTKYQPARITPEKNMMQCNTTKKTTANRSKSCARDMTYFSLAYSSQMNSSKNINDRTQPLHHLSKNLRNESREEDYTMIHKFNDTYQINKDLGSMANLVTTPSMQYQGESIEEVHFFYVSFYQQAKAMVRRLERSSKERKTGSSIISKKSIKAIKDEEESEYM